MFPLNAKLGFGSAGVALGAGAAGALARWGDPANSLHVLVAGRALDLVIVTICFVIGASVAELFKGKQ